MRCCCRRCRRRCRRIPFFFSSSSSSSLSSLVFAVFFRIPRVPTCTYCASSMRIHSCVIAYALYSYTEWVWVCRSYTWSILVSLYVCIFVCGIVQRSCPFVRLCVTTIRSLAIVRIESRERVHMCMCVAEKKLKEKKHLSFWAAHESEELDGTTIGAQFRFGFWIKNNVRGSDGFNFIIIDTFSVEIFFCFFVCFFLCRKTLHSWCNINIFFVCFSRILYTTSDKFKLYHSAIIAYTHIRNTQTWAHV